MTLKFTVAAVAALLAGTASAQTGSLNAICSTDQSWCEMAAKEFTKATGITVNQTRKATGEALAQIRAEASRRGGGQRYRKRGARRGGGTASRGGRGPAAASDR